MAVSERPAPLGEETARVLDCLPRAIVVRALDGTVLAWNERAEKLFGWAAADVIGQRFAESPVEASDATNAQSVLDRAALGEAWAGDISVRRSDGDVVLITSFVTPLRSGDGSVIATVTAAEDVTALRLLEQRTAELSDHLVLALAAGDLGTWRWDAATGATTWDDTVERLLGRRPDDDVGVASDWPSVVHLDDVDPTVSAFSAAVAGQTGYEVEHRVVWPDGSVHWLQNRGRVVLDDAGQVTGMVGCTSDITTRKLAELESQRMAEEADGLVAAERLRRERVEFLSTLNEAALSTPDLEGLMRVVVAAAVPRLGDWCTLHFIGEPNSVPTAEIAHVDPAKLSWVHELQARYPYDPGGASGAPAVIRSGVAEFVQVDQRFIDDALSETEVPLDEARAIVDTLQLTSMITVPLVTKRGVVGAMQFVSAESGRVYDEDDFELATEAATRIGAALDNAWLSEQHRHVASSLQEALLPVDVARIDGLGVAVRYWAAGTVNEVGGDFYDVFQIGPGRWAVVIGDVCGTGPQAAAVTAKARHTIRAAATHGVEHAEVLEWVNEAIIASGRGRFCTALYATIEPRGDGSWLFTSVAGGHPLPIRVAADGAASRLGRTGTLIGALRTIDLHPTETILHPGDTVVAYTDGITDVRPPYGLDDADVLQLIAGATSGGSTAEAVAERIEQAITDVLPIPDRGDDIALVVLRVDPAGLPT
jgi:PAS domain S-box-containing protein